MRLTIRNKLNFNNFDNGEVFDLIDNMLELIAGWGFYNSKYEFKYITDNGASQNFSGHNVLAVIDGFNIIIHIDSRNI